MLGCRRIPDSADSTPQPNGFPILPPRSGRLGRHTLRVAVDPFADAETRYQLLVEERRTGGLQARAFRLAVRDLAALDGECRRWMLRSGDGAGYRRERERWLPAEPPPRRR